MLNADSEVASEFGAAGGSCGELVKVLRSLWPFDSCCFSTLLSSPSDAADPLSGSLAPPSVTGGDGSRVLLRLPRCGDGVGAGGG